MIKKILTITFSAMCLTAQAQKMIVKVPVANLRITPTKVPAGTTAPALSMDMGGKESGQITQLLFNETLINEHDEHAPAEWLKVTALEQLTALDEPIPQGYIQANQVAVVDEFPINTLIAKIPAITSDPDHNNKKQFVIPMGAHLAGRVLFNLKDGEAVWLVTLPNDIYAYVPKDSVYEIKALEKYTEQQTRDALVDIAHTFLDTKFVWGGRSIALPDYPEEVTGVDSSGFVHLVFRVLNINIPRNTKHIFLKSLESPVLEGKDVKPGDVIFLLRPDTTVSPLIYLGDNEVIFATGRTPTQEHSSKHDYSPEDQAFLGVQVAALSDFFSTPLATLKNGDSPEWINKTRFPEGSKVCFGNFIKKL